MKLENFSWRVCAESGRRSLTWIDKELISQARMINVVNAGCEQCRTDFQWREDILQGGRVE